MAPAIAHAGAAVAAINDGDWFALVVVAAIVAFTCGFMVVRNA